MDTGTRPDVQGLHPNTDDETSYFRIVGHTRLAPRKLPVISPEGCEPLSTLGRSQSYHFIRAQGSEEEHAHRKY